MQTSAHSPGSGDRFVSGVYWCGGFWAGGTAAGWLIGKGMRSLGMTRPEDIYIDGSWRRVRVKIRPGDVATNFGIGGIVFGFVIGVIVA